MPSRGWYVVSVAILVGAIAGAIWFTVSRLGGMGTALVQVIVPGGATLELKQPGTYTIYHEGTSTVDGRIYASPNISGLRVSVRSADGKDIAVKRPTTTANYNFSGRSGTSVLAFDIDAPGTYRLDAAYGDGRQEPQAVLAVGTGFVGGLLITIALALGISFAGIAAALAIFLVVLLKRRRARTAWAH
jgi:hypothetical protein